MTLENLCEKYVRFCRVHDFPLISADDLITALETNAIRCTGRQLAWLYDFLEDWDLAARREAV
jgi:hypothetical protein